MITGDSGSGRTTLAMNLAAEFIQECEESGEDFRVEAYVSGSQRSEWREFLARLLDYDLVFPGYSNKRLEETLDLADDDAEQHLLLIFDDRMSAGRLFSRCRDNPKISYIFVEERANRIAPSTLILAPRLIVLSSHDDARDVETTAFYRNTPVDEKAKAKARLAEAGPYVGLVFDDTDPSKTYLMEADMSLFQPAVKSASKS